MANEVTKISDLDFDSIRGNLVSYLKQQDQFRDYNFEGSGISVLLDLLAYNSYQQNFFLNMAYNESFLSTAQKRDSVIQAARSLGYTPRSRTSSRITGTAELNITSGTPSTIEIPRNTRFNASIDGRTYTFTNIESATVIRNQSTGKYIYPDLELVEGTQLTQRYTVNTNNGDQRFLIPNPNVDITTITVSVLNSSTDSTTKTFNRQTNITQVGPDDLVFGVEEVEDGLYELFFGDGIIGAKLDNGNIVRINYNISSGPDANGIQKVNFSGAIDNVLSVTFTPNAPATGGAEKEDLRSIKYNAPRAYDTQNRAVTRDDYAALVRNQPNVRSVKAWGGEDNDPPVYGKVFLSIRGTDTESLSATEKETIIQNVLKPKNVVTIQPEIVDPDFIYIMPTVIVKHELKNTILGSEGVKKKVIAAIESYSNENLGVFDKYFRYSRLSKIIDNSEQSILNSLLSYQMRKEIELQLGVSTQYVINFENPVNNLTYGRPPIHPYAIGNAISSSLFTYDGYENCELDENGGLMRVFRRQGTERIGVSQNVGTIDYDTGKIVLNDFAPTALANGETKLKIYARPRGDSSDIIPVRNQIIEILDEDIDVSVYDDSVFQKA
jgi:hypothetical protein